MNYESRMRIDGIAIKLEVEQGARVKIDLNWLLNSEYAAEAARLGPLALSALAPYTTPAHVAELAATEAWRYRCLALKADLATLAAYEAEVATLEDSPIREVARLRAIDALLRGQGMPESLEQANQWHILNLLGVL